MEDSILYKYLQGECSEEEISLVESWSEETEENRKKLEQMYYTLFISDRIAVMDDVDTENKLKKFKKEIRDKQREKLSMRWKKTIGLVAAFIAGLIFTGGIAWNWISKNQNEYMLLTTVGQRAQTILPDGSKVWLNASTKLVYHNSFFSSERKVELSGEAFFEVAHNSRIPFIVTSKEISTRVVGTKFNMRARENEDYIVTTLFEGAVRMTTPVNEDGNMLKPGQAAIINSKNYKEVVKTYKYPDEVLLWMDDNLTFNQSSLDEITRKMGKMYNVEFVFSDNNLRKERFTAEFSTDSSIDDILNVLSHTNHFSYKQKGRIIYLIAK